MKRYVVLFLNEGEIHTEVVVANNFVEAYNCFMSRSIQHDEVYSIQRYA